MTTRHAALLAFLRKAGPARLLRLADDEISRARERREPAGRTLNLALQGGGALGAFTWGVLDRLQEEASVTIGAMSGASAGALNAAVYVTGLVNGGKDGAARALKAFWTEVSNAAALANLIFAPIMLGARRDAWQHAFRETAHFAKNPLQDLLPRHIDLDALRAPTAPRLFIAATNVLTARARIFTNEEITFDTLLASACIPTLHPTVLIDGIPYWDGGFSANPPVAPLLRTGAERTLLVRLLRSQSDTAPRDAQEIDTHLKTLLFSRPLEDELARIALSDPVGLGTLSEIDANQSALSARLTSHPTPHIVQSLFDQGRAAAQAYFAPERDAADVPAAADIPSPRRAVT